MCNLHKKNNNCQMGAGFGGDANFRKCWKFYFPQIRLPRKK